ncbi:hypothetical protein [Rathayibacter rathayi]|nr:hypothetical protein [Rathayibacter rathayi]
MTTLSPGRIYTKYFLVSSLISVAALAAALSYGGVQQPGDERS